MGPDRAERPSQPPYPPYPSDQFARAILGPREVEIFENLYVAYVPDARRVAQSILGHPEQADDAVHNAFVEMLRYVLSGRRWFDPGDAKAVVLRNTRWAAMKILRRRSTGSESREDSIEEAVGTVDDWARVEMRALCEQIIGQLGRRDQLALRLHFMEGLSHAKAGARMGISEAAFKSQLARAVRSARSAARAVGLRSLAGLVFRWPWRPTNAGGNRRTGGRFGSVLARLAMSTAAVAAGGASVAAWVAQSGQSPMPLTPLTSTAVTPPHLRAADLLYNSVIVDIVSVARPERPPIVLALGNSADCRCWKLFRSDDGGATWADGPGPAAAPPEPRIAVGTAFPTDPRIFIASGSSGRPLLEVGSFGTVFTAAYQPFPRLDRLTRAQDLAREVAQAAGAFNRAKADGGRCSVDGGESWGKCSGAPTR